MGLADYPQRWRFGVRSAKIGQRIELKEKVAQKIATLPEVSFLAMTSGDYDLEVDVMCRDNNHLVDFVNDISKIEGVHQTKTTIYFKVYKYAQPDLKLLK